MTLLILAVNTIVAIVLYYFTLNGINHFIDSKSSENEEEAKKDEFILKSVVTVLLLILLCGNGIIYYNMIEENGTVDVVEEE